MPSDPHPNLVGETTWFGSANCLGIDARLFFPGLGASVSEAKEVCRGCAVREECLSFALATGELTGIWGGRTEEERQAISDSVVVVACAEGAPSHHPSAALNPVA